MNLAKLVVEVRTLAAERGVDVSPASADVALAVLTGLGAMRSHEGQLVREILLALAMRRAEITFERSALDRLTPLALASLDRLLDGVLSGEMVAGELQDRLRPFLVRPLS